jgi:hypothetical protein
MLLADVKRQHSEHGGVGALSVKTRGRNIE